MKLLCFLMPVIIRKLQHVNTTSHKVKLSRQNYCVFSCSLSTINYNMLTKPVIKLFFYKKKCGKTGKNIMQTSQISINVSNIWQKRGKWVMLHALTVMPIPILRHLPFILWRNGKIYCFQRFNTTVNHNPAVLKTFS